MFQLASNEHRRPRRRVLPLVCCAALAGFSACDCGSRTSQNRPEIRADPVELDFGVATSVAPMTRTVTLSNIGRAPLDILSVSVLDDRVPSFTVATSSPMS